MKKGQSDNTYYYLIQFLIWPLTSVLIAFYTLNTRVLNIVIPLFYGIIGFTYQVVPGSDVNATIRRFEGYTALEPSMRLMYYWEENFIRFYHGMEIYIDTLSLVSSFFTSDYRFLLFIWGVTCGLVVASIISLLINRGARPINLVSLFLLFFFIFHMLPASMINGRFWLAAILFFRQLIIYLNKDSLSVALSTFACILIHQGFAIAFVLFVFWHFTKNYKLRYWIYYCFFILSILPSIFSSREILLNNRDILGGIFSEKVEGYTREEYKVRLEKHHDSKSTLGKLYTIRSNVFHFGLLLSLYWWAIRLKRHLINKKIEGLFLLILLFFSFSNFFMEVPSVGSRYRTIGDAICLLFLYFVSTEIKINFWHPITLLILGVSAINFVVFLRIEIEQLYAYTYLITPLLFYCIDSDTSFINLLKGL